MKNIKEILETQYIPIVNEKLKKDWILIKIYEDKEGIKYILGRIKEEKSINNYEALNKNSSNSQKIEELTKENLKIGNESKRVWIASGIYVDTE